MKSKEIEVKYVKLNKKAVEPTQGSEESACFDLYQYIDGEEDGVYLSPGKSVMLNTGLAFEFPKGYCMAIYSRSGLGFKHSICLSNCTGIADSDYRGEVRVSLINLGEKSVYLDFKNAIAQLKIEKVIPIHFKQVEELSISKRGSGGFGSTDGVKAE